MKMTVYLNNTSVIILNLMSCYLILLINKYFYIVSSGSIAVNKDSTVQILAEEAVAIDDLDKQVHFSS